MTDFTCSAAALAPELADWAAASILKDQLADEALTHNKPILFDALALAGITQVTVTFDGYGDSGQVESIDALAGEQNIQLPDTHIEMARSLWGKAETERFSVTLADALEYLAYDFLARTHCGWENNDGAYGEVVFDVAERSIVLDYNERFTSSENHIHYF